jgi:predicted double-glycine peptidase
MKHGGLPALLAALAGAGSLSSTAQAAELEVRGPQDGGFTTRVTSLREARYLHTLRQQFDFSCGSAAIVTLLNFHYGQRVTEREVFTQMFEKGDQPKIRKEGFSMLDMKRYLASKGFLADGFEQPIERLLQEKLPAIVLLSERGYRHFVVVKGIARGRLLIGDPAMGTRTISLERFRQLRVNDILFVIHNRREMARFNDKGDWRVAPPAPLAAGVDQARVLETLPMRRGGGY